jgi:hypothetical protein
MLYSLGGHHPACQVPRLRSLAHRHLTKKSDALVIHCKAEGPRRHNSIYFIHVFRLTFLRYAIKILRKDVWC